MTTLPIKSIADIVTDEVTAIQAQSNQQLDFTVGAVDLAIVEAFGGVAFWIQELIVILLSQTRAATSEGASLDTWMADYNFYRLAGTFSTGSVTFSRNSPTQEAIIPITTTQVQTVIGAITFMVVADTTNIYYNPTLQAYVIPISTNSIPVTVQALVVGTSGNVAANTITVILDGISGINTVNNSTAFTNGANEETDAQFRSRFILYINSLSKATLGAIIYAIESVQDGIEYSVVENFDYNGNVDLGFFYAVIDDGTGDPPSQLLTSVTNAINAVRGLTIRFNVYAVVPVPVAFVINAIYNPSFDETDTENLIIASITNFIQGTATTAGLGIGNSLPITRVDQLAYNASPGVVNVTSITLNGSGVDIDITVKQRITINGAIIVNLTPA